MRFAIRTVTLFLCLLSAFAAFAIDTEEGVLTMDLALLPPNAVMKFPGGDAKYHTIRIRNAIPRYVPYVVSIAIEDVGIAPLVFPGAQTGGGRNGQDVLLGLDGGGADPCQQAMEDLIAALDAVETERKVSEIGAAAIAGAPPGCRGKITDLFKLLTQYDIPKTIAISSSQTLTIIAARPGVTFTMILTGTARGEWRTSYGFFFVPDNDERYFVEEEKATTAGTASKFFIRKQSDREEFDFVPTVVFTFFPNGASRQESVFGFTGGLGYDLEKPFVFGGASWAYNENIILTGGLAFHRQSRLLGKYKKDQEITASLEPNQLVEDTYGPNVYLGISFRFNEDIHARRNAAVNAADQARQAADLVRANAAAADEELKIRKAECLARADAAEASAKLECAKEQDAGKKELCLAKATADLAAAKAKCPLTELERVKAERDARRATCNTAATAEYNAALAKCAKDLEDCKKTAGSSTSATQACETTATLCKANAEDALAKKKVACGNQ